MKNIVFDFGAVLFNWQPRELIAEIWPELTCDADRLAERAKAVFDHPDWHAFDQGLHTLPGIAELTAERLRPLGVSRAQVDALLCPIGERLTPIECTVALLHRLADRRDAQVGLRLYYLSNMPTPFARDLERKHAFLQRFDGGLFSSDVKLIKPGLAVFEHLAANFEFVGAKTLFIDDNLPNVLAAQSLGWHTHHCVNPADVAQAVDAFLA